MKILFLSLCCSLLFISRFQVLLWLAPIVIINLIFLVPRDLARSLLHWTSFFTIALGPISFVLLKNYQKTGYLTGMERFDWNARNLPDFNQYFATSTGFLDNITLTLKTFFLDFISPLKYADHAQNRASNPISGLEAVVIALCGAIFVSIILTIVRQVKEHGSLPNLLREKWRTSPVTFLAVEFFLGYIIVTIIAWTIGNNDPIYSRFLYPSYVFLIIALFSAYAESRTHTSRIDRFLFEGLFLSLAAIQIYKIAQTIIYHYVLTG